MRGSGEEQNFDSNKRPCGAGWCGDSGWAGAWERLFVMGKRIVLVELEQRPGSESLVVPPIPMELLKLRGSDWPQVNCRATEVKQLAAQGDDEESNKLRQARRQRESNGGWATGYNAQLATDAKEKIVVGRELTNNASDAQQLEPTLADMERHLGQKPRQVLADKGYNSRANIAAMQAARIEYATPAAEPGQGSTAAARAAGIQPGFEAKFFVYDEATDTFQCAANKTLKYR